MSREYNVWMSSKLIVFMYLEMFVREKQTKKVINSQIHANVRNPDRRNIPSRLKENVNWFGFLTVSLIKKIPKWIFF